MADGRTTFVLVNRTANPLLVRLLRAPGAHHLLSHRLALITVTGRKSGREFTFPVRYTERDDTIRIVPSMPERKVWWRNLRDGGAPVRIRIRGHERAGHAIAEGTAEAGVVVTVRLDRAAQ
jgi:hypothetical protein